jgi:hypothetical protein
MRSFWVGGTNRYQLVAGAPLRISAVHKIVTSLQCAGCQRVMPIDRTQALAASGAISGYTAVAKR